MTCGDIRSVFTVINALCNSLKTIKEAEVFFLFLLFSGSSDTLCTAAGPMSRLLFTTVCHYSAAPRTVVGISGRLFAQWERWRGNLCEEYNC